MHPTKREATQLTHLSRPVPTLLLGTLMLVALELGAPLLAAASVVWASLRKQMRHTHGRAE